MRKSLIAVLLFGTLGTALPTFADPIRVTGGLSDSASDITDFLLSWPGFKLFGATNSGSVLDWCHPCQPGDLLRLTPFTSGFMSFKSDTITVPNLPPGTATDIAWPFTFEAQFTGTGGVLDLTVSGLATISLFHVPGNPGCPGCGPGGIFARSLNFALAGSLNFAPLQEAAPVPEPATLLLTGVGLAGAFSARRRRKQT